MTGSAIHRLLRRHWLWGLLLLFVWAAATAALVRPAVNAHRFLTLHKVLKSGRLTVITRHSPHCYYTYRDQPMGFEYELAQGFADHLGVELAVEIADDWDAMVALLEQGRGALVAASMPITARRRRQVAFSNGYMEIQPHLIVGRRLPPIERPEELAGKVVHVREGSVYAELIERLRQSGIPVELRRVPELPTEELIRMVSEGAIDITVAHSHIALLNRRHYPDIQVAAAVGRPHWLAWATHPAAQELLAKVNEYFSQIMQDGTFDRIFDRYYGDIHEFDYVDLKTFHRRIDERLWRYSPFIKEAARRQGFDWRLIAAQMYQESQWRPWVESPAGAKGLMQLLPRTALGLGLEDIYNPVANIEAGVRHLRELYEQFEEIAGEDRLLVSLAAYNIGAGHVQDARRLARRLGMDPDRWESLEKALPLLKLRKYYKDATHGYCRGDEPVTYVRRILLYYDILRRRGIEFGQAQAGLQPK